MNRNSVFAFPFFRNPLAILLAVPVVLFILVIFLPLLLLVLLFALLFGHSAVRTFHFGGMNGNVPPQDSQKTAPDDDVIDVEVIHSDSENRDAGTGKTHDPSGRNILE